MGEDEKVEDKVATKGYVCIETHFTSRIVKVGEKMQLKGDEPFINHFKLRKSAEEEFVGEEDEEPETLADVHKQEAQKVIDDLNAGQASDVDEPVVQTEEVPTKGLGAEPSAEKFLK